MALWLDPRDGREWIYYGSDEEGKDGEEHCPAVYRTLLDNPGAGELVWNKTRVSVNSFQLSADGRMAGGQFPWPEGGVAQLPNQSMKALCEGLLDFDLPLSRETIYSGFLTEPIGI